VFNDAASQYSHYIENKKNEPAQERRGSALKKRNVERKMLFEKLGNKDD